MLGLPSRRHEPRAGLRSRIARPRVRQVSRIGGWNRPWEPIRRALRWACGGSRRRPRRRRGVGTLVAKPRDACVMGSQSGWPAVQRGLPDWQLQRQQRDRHRLGLCRFRDRLHALGRQWRDCPRGQHGLGRGHRCGRHGPAHGRRLAGRFGPRGGIVSFCFSVSYDGSFSGSWNWSSRAGAPASPVRSGRRASAGRRQIRGRRTAAKSTA